MSPHCLVCIWKIDGYLSPRVRGTFYHVGPAPLPVYLSPPGSFQSPGAMHIAPFQGTLIIKPLLFPIPHSPFPPPR
jgi:hypothetical protein